MLQKLETYAVLDGNPAADNAPAAPLPSKAAAWYQLFALCIVDSSGPPFKCC